jgi:formylglycine-generating enzyme required for sulfatase activity
MSGFSKSITALAATAILMSCAGVASAKPKRVKTKKIAPTEQAEPSKRVKPSEQTAPIRHVRQEPDLSPRQYFPIKAVQPLTPEIEQTLLPKDSFKECETCPEMVVVPRGTFMMGTPLDEPYRDKGEGPAHAVTIARPFAVARFTISFDEWDACLADGGCNGVKGDERGFGRGRMPADGVNFEAAKSYLAWLSRKVGRTYRLPSEAEREYFTRAGSTTPFWFGKTITPQDANYDARNNYPGGPYGDASKGPRPVDSYLPNPFGLYQVSGNVHEWTEDCYNKRYNEDAPVDGSAWLDGDCGRRMVRGGGWNGSASSQRAGNRENDIASIGLSFRVVRTLAVP